MVVKVLKQFLKQRCFFQKHHANFSIRATVSEYSLPYLIDIVDLFIKYFPNKAVGFEALIPLGRGKSSPIKQPNVIEYSNRIIELLKYTEGKPIRIINSVSSEFNGIRPVFCTSVGIPNWNVLVNGKISACSREEAPSVFNFGTFNDKTKIINFNNQNLKIIQNMNVLNYDECKDCFCKYHCAGDCPVRRLSHLTNCESIRKIATYVLNNKLMY